jgi:Ser/Thr protein kinase RdoA (MazF antagonist)
VAGRKLGAAPDTFRLLGELLGRLGTLPSPPVDREGGAWHHLALEGGPAAEVRAAVAMLEAARRRVPAAQRTIYDDLCKGMEQSEDGRGLPRAFIHPDLVPANAIAAPGGAVIIDWTGAGVGPRIWPLAFLLWACGRDLRRVDAAVAGYRRHAIGVRPLVFVVWGFCTGRTPLSDAVDGLPAIHAQAEKIAARARRAFATGTDTLR